MHGVGIIMEIEGVHCRQSRALLLSIRQGALWKHIHTARNGPQRKTEQRSNTEPAGLKMEWDVCFAHRLFCISLSSKATTSNQLHTPGKTENQHCFMNKSFFFTSCLFLVMNWHCPPSFFASGRSHLNVTFPPQNINSRKEPSGFRIFIPPKEREHKIYIGHFFSLTLILFRRGKGGRRTCILSH